MFGEAEGGRADLFGWQHLARVTWAQLVPSHASGPPRIMVWKQWAAAACGAMMAGLAAGYVSSTPSPCLFLAQARGRSDLIRARSRAICHARRT